MIRRLDGNLVLREGPVPAASHALERDGYALLPGVLGREELDALAREIACAFEERAGRRASDQLQFRHEMLNHAAGCQHVVGHRAVLDVIEPLLGDDCHVIANTAWRNPPSFAGGAWHCDGGPHVPRPLGVPWDERIPYPVFAVGVHFYVQDCLRESGPTAVVPGSHRSGRLPPPDRQNDDALTYDGRPPAVLEARAGDVALFVSDSWHRGMAAEPGGSGRLFLQAHYGRRDIAQRLRTTAEANQLSSDTRARIDSPRERCLLGLHEPHFYDG